MRLVLIVAMFLISFSLVAQSTGKKSPGSGSAPQRNAPNSLDPAYAPQKAYAPKRAKKTISKGPTYNLEHEYYERVEALEKARRKNEKLMLKPQYSNPMYFGHKRPPKKNKPGKMKFCKECGIRH